MPMPTKRRCKCGSKIEDWMDRCLKCLTFCPCGRRIDYAGRGRPRSRQCERCAELRRDRRLCCCGKPLIKSQRAYCSARCAREARRIRNGATPRDGWRRHIISALERDKLDHAAAVRVGAWLARRMDRGLEVRGTAVVYTLARVRFEVRWTHMDFGSAADLPDWVPVEDSTRLETMRMMQPELRGYILSNARRDAWAVTSAAPDAIARWKSRRCYIPRLADYDLELSAPADSFQVDSLVATVHTCGCC